MGLVGYCLVVLVADTSYDIAKCADQGAAHNGSATLLPMDDRRRRELLEEQARREAARDEANATGRSRYDPATRLREIEARRAMRLASDRAKEAEERRATSIAPLELSDDSRNSRCLMSPPMAIWV